MKFHSDRFIPPRNDHTVWTFPTDAAGRHKCGPAVIAHKNFRARYGVGRGLTGSAYAIAAFDKSLQPLPLAEIAEQVAQFIAYAQEHAQTAFFIARFECDEKLWSYSEESIARLFSAAPINCSLPQSWQQHLMQHTAAQT